MMLAGVILRHPPVRLKSITKAEKK